ncbi:MAG: ABC transporter permease [Gemmataceae bacterium]|nr:ABC transporter permease [Gemmataceae bacterium]
MRAHILAALLRKEWDRHLANRGGVALGLLLVAAAVLMGALAPDEAAGSVGRVGGAHHCFVEFDAQTPLVAHLARHVPPELAGQVLFRPLADADAVDGLIVYDPGVGAIQVRQPPGGPVRVSVWYPDGDPAALARFEGWFWREARRAFADEARRAGRELPPDPPFGPDETWLVLEAHGRLRDRAGAAVPELAIDRKGLGGAVLDIRAAVATGMVAFALYFACVYLLATLTCEERERGLLLAQALSPASPAEIVAAKALFYPALGGALAAIVAGAYRPAVLADPFFWLSLAAVGGGFLGVGMTVAALARTQRAAFLGAMGYLLAVSLLLLGCTAAGVRWVPYLAVEYHGPRVLHAALTGAVSEDHWGHLLAAAGLAAGWLLLAGWLFRRVRH